MKAIILAGGSGSRLMPMTSCVCKQLLPVYDKPMIYYPLSTLMLLGLRDILIISTPDDSQLLQRHLGSGAELGIRLSYAVQTHPRGLPEAFLIGEEFIGDESVCLMLGDNLIYWAHLRSELADCVEITDGAYVLGCTTSEPHRFGIAEFDHKGRIVSIEEKPQRPKSDQAIIGLYFYDRHVTKFSRLLKPSARGELEISDLNNMYIADGKLRIKFLTRGAMWLDVGTPSALLQASNFISVIQNHQGLLIGSPEEVAFNMKYISRDQLLAIAKDKFANSAYGRYLERTASYEPQYVS